MRQQTNDPTHITQKTKDCSICCTTNKRGVLEHWKLPKVGVLGQWQLPKVGVLEQWQLPRFGVLEQWQLPKIALYVAPRTKEVYSFLSISFRYVKF